MVNNKIEKQTITSANTSLHQIPAVYTNYEFKKGSLIFDYGCGAYFDDISDYAKYNNGCCAIGYDPYNRTEEQNNKAIDIANNIGVDYLICSNVLNVLSKDEYINNVLDNIVKISNDNTKIIFCIYQGDKKGVGKLTKNGSCWQRNEKTNGYIKYIKPYMNVNKVSGKFIEAELYKDKSEVAV